MRLRKRLFQRLMVWSKMLAPQNRLGDRYVAWIDFRLHQRRWPSKNKMLFYDVLYRLKTSDEIRDPLRVFVTDKEFVRQHIQAVIGDQYKALPHIWSIGHRIQQSAAIHPESGKLWTVEHGARGGDEINIPQAGKNYGWPVITYGRDYSGAKIGVGTQQSGMEQPV